MSSLPLLVFDTNILMDLLLGRDGSSVLLVDLAERQQVDLIVPEFVLFEFRGTALRWVRNERVRLANVRQAAKEWSRSRELNEPAHEVFWRLVR